jgi:hypothetical protein
MDEQQRLARRAAEADAIGDLAAAAFELRRQAPRLVTESSSLREASERNLVDIESRMVAAHTRIYTASDDDDLIGWARGLVFTGMAVIGIARSQPFDPAAYEVTRSSFERTFRELRQRQRVLAGLAELPGDPTNETASDYEGEGDPLVV